MQYWIVLVRIVMWFESGQCNSVTCETVYYRLLSHTENHWSSTILIKYWGGWIDRLYSVSHCPSETCWTKTEWLLLLLSGQTLGLRCWGFSHRRQHLLLCIHTQIYNENNLLSSNKNKMLIQNVVLIKPWIYQWLTDGRLRLFYIHCVWL